MGTSKERSQAQVIVFCCAWVGVHLLVAALLEAVGLALNLSRPAARHVFWGTVLFTIQAPLLTGWLGAWKDTPAWAIGGVLLGALNFVAVPFLTGMAYGMCLRAPLPNCVERSMMLPILPIGLLLGLVQWLLGRRHARRTAWLIPAQVVGIVAFAIVLIRLTLGAPSSAGAPLPASVLATLAYALVVALALPGLRPRPQ
jgi:hypothetical protein